MLTKQPPDREKEIIYVPAYSEMMAPGESEVDLFRLWQVIWDAKWFIGGFTLAATLLAVFVTLFVLPVTYRSQAVLLPEESESKGIGSLQAALAGSLSLPINLPGGEKGNQIMSFLESRNLKQRLIEKYELLPRLYDNLWDAAKREWTTADPQKRPTVTKALQDNIFKDNYIVSQDKKTNLISVFWEDEDPAFAALMLQRLITELTYYLDNEYESDARREREFVEVQLYKATKELEHWEQQVPSKDLTMGIIQRERLAAQAVYTELRKAVEMARIAEAKGMVRFKVLDPPFVPENKYGPQRARICTLTLFASAFFAIVIVFLGRGRVQKINAVS